MLATKKMTPTLPPNSGPKARLIMTGRAGTLVKECNIANYYTKLHVA